MAQTSIRATYRLQFTKSFPFPAGQALAPYFRELGISHVYASPILKAREGSLHGYDVVAYDAISPELGGEAGFRDLAGALREHGIGIVLDIVPNHMAVGGADNKLWLDLLRNGRDSRYARWFDVDFDVPDPLLAGKVYAPFLEGPYAQVLRAGGLELVAVPEGGYAVAHAGHRFPIRPQDEPEIAALGIAAYADPERLDGLIRRQNFVPDWWRNAGDRINWRRFFDINQLAAIRMEEPDAFAAKHAMVLGLYRDGLIDGVRVDHIDGLADPAGYCRDLRALLDAVQGERPEGLREGRAWIVVEKILAANEPIPAGWNVDGSTGYDFMDQISALQHDDRAEAMLAAHWAVLSGRPRDFHAEEELARLEILSHSFGGAGERLIDALEDAGASDRAAEGLTRLALGRAVTSLLMRLRAYRSYATGEADYTSGKATGAALDRPMNAALRAAMAQPLSDLPALRFIAEVFAGEGEDALKPARMLAVRRFNQLSAPLAAKAVEDTAFYRYGRLVSRNDVGFDASRLGLGTGVFHELMAARAKRLPASLLATATHDHKRGEDVRARLAVLSEQPARWIAATRDWSRLAGELGVERLDAGDEYQLWQMLAGAWPLDLGPENSGALADFAARIGIWHSKALREAKLRSGWATPDQAYEERALRFLHAALLTDVGLHLRGALAGYAQSVAAAGCANALVQLAVRCTAPGVPDTYQGTEFWDFSLVDPDNRRPVDYAALSAALADCAPLCVLAASWRDGRVKQALLRCLLQLRATLPEVFAMGSYEPVAVEGERADHVVAFRRVHSSGEVLVVGALRLTDALDDALAPPPQWWGDTRLLLPMNKRVCAVAAGPDSFSVRLVDLMPDIPVAVLQLA